MSSAARSGLDAGSSFAVSRALDIRGENESPLANLGEKGIQGSSPSQGNKIGHSIWQSMTLPSAEREEGAREGRSLFLFVPTKG